MKKKYCIFFSLIAGFPVFLGKVNYGFNFTEKGGLCSEQIGTCQSVSGEG
jgi:hypothetical protein